MRNKNVLSVGLVIAILVPFLASFNAFANTEPDSMSRNEKIDQQKAEVRQKMDDVKEKAKEVFDKTKVKRIETLQTLMKNQLDRSQKALDRLNQVLVRIESRRGKMVAAGLNVTTVDAQIVKAKGQKVAIQAAIDKSKTNLASLSVTTSPKSVVQAYMLAFKDIKKQLITYHKSLKEIVKTMRQLEPKPEGSAKIKVEENEDAEVEADLNN